MRIPASAFIGLSTLATAVARAEDGGRGRALHDRAAGRGRGDAEPNRLGALILPNESGQKLRDPIDKLSDEQPVVSLEYPGRGSMQWFEYHSQQAGLYLASYDESLDYTQMCFGRTGEAAQAAMWIVKYPFAVSGSTCQSPDLAVRPHPGNWHWGADRYRAWLETWVAARRARHLLPGVRADPRAQRRARPGRGRGGRPPARRGRDRARERTARQRGDRHL